MWCSKCCSKRLHGSCRLSHTLWITTCTGRVRWISELGSCHDESDVHDCELGWTETASSDTLLQCWWSVCKCYQQALNLLGKRVSEIKSFTAVFVGDGLMFSQMPCGSQLCAFPRLAAPRLVGNIKPCLASHKETPNGYVGVYWCI